MIFGAADAFDSALSAIATASAKAQALLDANSNWYNTISSSVLSGWKSDYKESQVAYRQLLATVDKARADPTYAKKWVETARAALSGVNFISNDAAGQGVWNNANAALDEAIKTIVKAVITGTESLVGGAVTSAAGPILGSWLFWVAAALGGAYLFRGRITRRLTS